MAVRPLSPATDRRLGGPLPRQLANLTRAHLIPPEFFTQGHATPCAYAVLAAVSNCCPPVHGRLPTRYSPVRHSVTLSSFRRIQTMRFVRLACVKHAASVHPEPGSNSLIKFVRVQENPWLSLSSFFTVCLLSQFSKNFFGIFEVGCFTVQLSKCFCFAVCLVSLATASISYDDIPELSTPNLKIFFIPYFAWFSVFCLNSVKTKKERII